MNVKIKYLFIFLSLLLSAVCQSNGMTDSLELALKKAKTQDIRFKILMELGNEIMNSDKQRAIDVSDEALQIAIDKKDKLMHAQVLLLKGRIAETEGKNKKALTLFIQANKYFEENNDQKGIGQTLNNIGIIHWYNRDYDRAIDYFNQAYEAHKKAGDKYGMSTNRVNIAIIYDELGKYAEALVIYEEALKLFVELNDEWSIAACYNNIGLNYTSTKLFNQADASYKKAIEIYRKLNDRPGIASALNNIGYNLLQNQKYKEAIPYLKESLLISEEDDYRYDQKLALLNLANCYSGINQYKEAFEYHRKYSEIKDSILNTESNKTMQEMEARYSGEKKNMEIKNLKRTRELEKSRQIEKDAKREAETRTKNTILFSVLGLVLITAGLFYWRYVQKKKDNLVLQSKNEEISKQKNIIEEKNKDITDSIHYAKTIQDSVLPEESDLKKYFDESFVLFLPRDIVSGDFFWFTALEDKIIFTVGDCTGHGVPGSLMSMMGINLLHQIIREDKISDPSIILTELDNLLAKRFSKADSQRKANDGMDIAVGVIEKTRNIFSYASALRPVYMLRNGELMEFKSDTFPIGGSQSDKIFKTREVEIRKGDSIYLTTDGFADQFGGDRGKKFLTKRLKELIEKNASQSMQKQKDIFLSEFITWKGNHEQVDDVCVMGIRI